MIRSSRHHLVVAQQRTSLAVAVALAVASSRCQARTIRAMPVESMNSHSERSSDDRALAGGDLLEAVLQLGSGVHVELAAHGEGSNPVLELLRFGPQTAPDSRADPSAANPRSRRRCLPPAWLLGSPGCESRADMLGAPGKFPSGDCGMAETSTISEQPRGLQMSLPAKAENVAVVRHALAGLAEQIGMDEAGHRRSEDRRHRGLHERRRPCLRGRARPAHGRGQPRRRWPHRRRPRQGRGIRPQADVDAPSLRLGLSLIAALSSSFAISGGLDRGTEVSMRLPLRGGGADGGGPTAVTTVEHEALDDAHGGARRSPGAARPGARPHRRRPRRAPRPLRRPRLRRGPGHRRDRRRGAPGFTDGRVRLGLEERRGRIELRLGPMEAGGAERDPRASSTFRRSAARWRRWPTSSRSRTPRRRLPADRLRGCRSCSLICSRIRLRARRRMRETCICEWPIRSAICDWVMSSTKRSRRTSRSRSSR